MARITRIETQKTDPDRVNIYIEGFCTGAERRVVENLGLREGMEVTCRELMEMLSFYWKNEYRHTWEEERERIRRVEEKIREHVPDLVFERFGFGTDTSEMIRRHPREKGIPDIAIVYKKNGFTYILTLLEVTGTAKSIREEDGLWIRPDKFEFARNHPHLDIYIAHYVNTLDLLRFIPASAPESLPQPEEKSVGGRTELYIELPPSHPLITSLEEFAEHLRRKIRAMTGA